MPQIPGKLISIEGGEGAGKTTVMQAIRDCLEQAGKNVVCTREPGGTDVGEEIRRILLTPGRSIDANTELLLMFASRAQLVSALIKPALARGDFIVTDRFTDASFAYQGGGRGLDESDIRELEKRFVGIQPDLTLLLDLSVDQGMARAQSRGQSLDRIESERHDFFLNVRAAYLRRAAEDPQRIKIIDASQTAESVVRQVLDALTNWMQA
jgi:dTMP kinase